MKKEVKKMTRQDMSEVFMETFKVEKDFSPENREKLFKLLLEEVVELGTSLGIKRFDIQNSLKNIKQTEWHPAGDKIGILDSVIDIEFILNQVKIISGISHVNLIRGYQRVFLANMSKLQEGVPVYYDGTDKRFPAGKIKKPDNWKPADLSDLV